MAEKKNASDPTGVCGGSDRRGLSDRRGGSDRCGGHEWTRPAWRTMGPTGVERPRARGHVDITENADGRGRATPQMETTRMYNPATPARSRVRELFCNTIADRATNGIGHHIPGYI